MLASLTTALLSLVPAAQDSPLRTYVEAIGDAWQAFEAGDLARARAGYLACLERSPENATCAYHLACVAALAGDLELSMERLAQAVEWGWCDADVALWDDDLAALRDSGRFQALVTRMRSAQPREATTPSVQILWDPLVARSWPQDPARWDEGLREKWTRPLSRSRWPAIAPDGSVLLLPCSDGTLRCVDARTLEESNRIQVTSGTLLGAVFDRSGSRLLVHENGGRSHLLEWPTACVVAEFRGEACAASLSPDGRRVLLRSESGQLQIWNDGKPQPSIVAHRGGLHLDSVLWRPDGALLVMGGSADGGAAGWLRFVDPLQGGHPIVEVDLPRPVRCTAFSYDGSTLAVGTAGGLVWILDGATGALLREIAHAGAWGSPDSAWGQEVDVRSLAFTADGSTLLTSTGAVFGAHAWSLESGRERWHLDFSVGNAGWLEFVSDPIRSRVLIVDASMRGCNRVVDTETGGASLDWSERDITRAAFLPGGERVLAIESGAITLLDGETLRALVSRVDYEGLGGMLISSAGFVDVDARTAAWVRVLAHGGLRWFEDLAPKLLDPKRVRAAAEGIEVLPVTLK